MRLKRRPFERVLNLSAYHEPGWANSAREKVKYFLRSFRQSVDYTEGRKAKNSRRARAMVKGSS